MILRGARVTVVFLLFTATQRTHTQIGATTKIARPKSDPMMAPAIELVAAAEEKTGSLEKQNGDIHDFLLTR